MLNRKRKVNIVWMDYKEIDFYYVSLNLFFVKMFNFYFFVEIMLKNRLK